METETLSNYEQSQSRHILDESMDGNIPREDDEVDSLLTKDVSEENSERKRKESFSDSTESLKEAINCRDSENKENEKEDCDVSFTNNESNDYEESEGENQTAESEEENKNEEETKSEEEANSEKENDISEMVGSANRSTASSPAEEDPLEREKVVFNENEEPNPSTEEKDPLAEDNEDENFDVEKDKNIDEEKKTENEPQNTELDKVQVEESENEKEHEDKEEKTDSNESMEKNGEATSASEEITEKQINEDAKESCESMEENSEIRDISKDYPLLKETLTKTKGFVEQQKEGDTETLEDVDMDEDLDPSLLCPDIAMEVDEAPVITTNDSAPGNEGSKSPLLYEAAFSTYVDEMTGAEVSFNLTMEEQQMRQELYGEDNPVQYTRIHCTACNVHLGSALDGQSNRFVHPLLKVLICKDCYHFYTSGEFEKDEDGSELYCRWCGQGGQVMCCSQCEMVFCKKCIRINFGRKKLVEIKDSDEWLCFRCDSFQLTSLRVHCAEFMEYVRREISRAATLENATSFTTTDYSQCCISQKKKISDPSTSEPKKKKRKSSVDPDYDPIRDQPSPQPSTSAASSELMQSKNSLTSTVIIKKQVPILPKPTDPNHNAGIVTVSPKSDSVFRVGNTTFRPRTSVYTTRPRVQVVTSTSVGPRPTSSNPGYIKLMPGVLPGTATGPRGLSAQTYVSPSTVRPQAPFQNRAVRPTAPSMKHEWFEKTVRAAARVNSNLSYTLTQLNRAQASATTVEALAVVHNKLQEILSTSINSLIQIRKNLRQEFIAGIKNIRFQAKPPQTQPSQLQSQKFSSTQDDDVIFVSPTPSPGPPPLIAATSTSSNTFSAINLPPSVSLNPIKKTPAAASLPKTDTLPSTTTENTIRPAGGFLRVKSLTALQSVPAECITIPDDPIPPPPLTPIKRNTPEISIIKDSTSKNEAVETTDAVETVELENEKREAIDDDVIIANGDNCNSVLSERATNASVNEEASGSTVFTYNLKNKTSPELKKMMDIKVYLKRSEEIDRLVKNTFGLVNGDVSE